MTHILLLIVIYILTSSSIWAQVGWNKAYENGLVVSAEEAASKVGRYILQQGGNAVDAAIAVQSHSPSRSKSRQPRRRGFMVAHRADGTVCPGLPRARTRARPPRYVPEPRGNYLSDLSKTGALAVGVPGRVDGMAKAHARFGSMPWADLVAPAISLAREGYALSYSQASSLN